MINISMKQRVGKGFTITELLVATAVFSSVLLLAIVGFTQIGRLFYKGVTVSQTRQTATQIMAAVSDDIRLSATAVSTATYICNPLCTGSASTLNAFCIGNHIYIPNSNKIDLSNHDFVSNFGLIQAQLPSDSCNGGSGTGGAYTSADIASYKPVEMLGDNMRISNFDVSEIATASYGVSITVSYGEDSVFVDGSLTSSQPACKGISTGSQFCAVVQLNSTVSSRPSLL